MPSYYQLADSWFCTPEVAGSMPVEGSKYSSIVQLVEHSAVNRVVVGSSPSLLTIQKENFKPNKYASVKPSGDGSGL